ncbi:MAG: LysR family transcriptional regulator [Clostridium perfringens]|nr:LysR family transcriptional regulator [Clostridium perfringens]
MNLNQLYYFKTVAKLEHFRNAAKELHISQPSLSHSISTLEEELDTKLFEKQGRCVKLTKYGKIFLNYVEKSLDTLELGEEKLKKFTSSTKGNVDIAYVAPLSSYYIPKAVRNFLDKNENKDITFTFKQELTTDVIEGLKSSKYDIGFCSFVKDEPSIAFEPILKQELVLIVPNNHKLSNLKSINIEEAQNYPLVAYNKNSGLGKFTLKLFEESNISPNVIFQGEDENAIAGLVSENFGIAIVAKIPQLNNFNIKQIPINNIKQNRYIYLTYLKDRYFPHAVNNFIDHVKNLKLSI